MKSDQTNFCIYVIIFQLKPPNLILYTFFITERFNSTCVNILQFSCNIFGLIFIYIHEVFVQEFDSLSPSFKAPSPPPPMPSPPGTPCLKCNNSKWLTSGIKWQHSLRLRVLREIQDWNVYCHTKLSEWYLEHWYCLQRKYTRNSFTMWYSYLQW